MSRYEADLAVSVVSFISWKTLAWSLPHTNKWTSRREEENSLYPYISMPTLWKTCPPSITNMLSIKNSSILMFYYYYQLQRTFLQNQCFFCVFFLTNKICPFLRQGIYSYVGQSLLWNTVLAKLILLFCLVALNGE